MTIRARAFVVLVALFFVSTVPSGAQTIQTLDGITVAVWRPPTSDPAPLLLFSHGFKGCATQSTFLLSALATAGYLVVAPNHADASCGGDAAGMTQAFSDPASWTEATYRNRATDLTRVLAALETDPAFAWRREQVGLVGHSLGGYTVLGLGGAWPTWRIAQPRAILALSPYCEPFSLTGELGNIGRPVMYQGGTRDLGVTPSVRRVDGCYAQTTAPAAYVEFRGAGHFAWTDLQPEHQAIIVRYSLAFLDTFVRGLNQNIPVRESAVSDLRVK